MSHHDFSESRRNFLKLSAAAASGLLFTQTQGCSSGHFDIAPPPIDYRMDLVLTHCNIVDVMKGVVRKNKSIVIQNGHIVDIRENMAVTDNMEVIDMKDHYLIPGLIDGHCHTTLPSVGGFDLKTALATVNQMKQNFLQQTANGVTTVRDTSAFVNFLRDFIYKIDKGCIAGPRVVHCGAWFNLDGSHPGDIKPSDISRLAPLAIMFTGEMFISFKDVDELNRRMEKNLNTHPSFMKLSLDDESLLCGKEGKNPVYTDAHKRALLKFSETHDLPMAGHIHYKSGFDLAQELPLFNMEHMVLDQALADKDIYRMADNRMSIVPTMTLGPAYAIEEVFDDMPKAFQTDFIKSEQKAWRKYFDTEMDRYALPAIAAAQREYRNGVTRYPFSELYKRKIFVPKPSLYYGYLTHGVESLKKMKQAGILIGCGTDAGVPLQCHGTLWREMMLYKRIGFSNGEILKCATINNARILRMADKIGTLDVGKFADLTVLVHNPLEAIEAVKDPVAVMKEGKIMYSRHAMAKYRNITTL